MGRPRKQIKQDPSTTPLTVKAVQPRTNEPEPMPVKESVKEPQPKTGNSAVMDKIMANIQDLEQRDRDLDAQHSELLRQLDQVKEEQYKVKGRRSALSATLLLLEQTEQRAQHIFEIA